MSKNSIPEHAFYQLDPERVLQATENCGWQPTGEFTQLNSYENRVFDIVLENVDSALETPHIIGKFYRPRRWSQEAVLEEHQFLFDLKAEGVPVVAPLIQKNKSSLSVHYGMNVGFFPKVLGRMPQEFLDGELKQVGRLIARLHNVGAKSKAYHRPVLDTSYYGGWPTLERLSEWVVPEMWSRYEEAAMTVLDFLDARLEPENFIRIHGDCHKGNLLSNANGFFFVDFDDFCTGPVVQDMWMLLSGDLETAEKEKEQILSGYEELRHFNDADWDLIPALRGLRIISYAGWIAARWDDPSFPKIFPEFGSYGYWAEETEALEKIAWSLS